MTRGHSHFNGQKSKSLDGCVTRRRCGWQRELGGSKLLQPSVCHRGSNQQAKQGTTSPQTGCGFDFSSVSPQPPTMEEQASTLLATLKRSSVPVETKVQQFNNLKSSIKHLRVPDAAQATSFECIRIAITSSSPQLVTLGFSTLGHLTKRLSLQEQSNVVVAQSNKMLPVFLERLGDAREAHRSAASSALADIWPLNREKVEVLVRDSAMAGQNARAKETAMKWLVKMHKTDGFLLRSFVPPLVAGLEDADGVVRETAKSAVVELFRCAGIWLLGVRTAADKRAGMPRKRQSRTSRSRCRRTMSEKRPSNTSRRSSKDRDRL